MTPKIGGVIEEKFELMLMMKQSQLNWLQMN